MTNQRKSDARISEERTPWADKLQEKHLCTDVFDVNSKVKNKHNKDNLKSHQHVGKGKGSVRKKTFPFVNSCNNFRQSKRDSDFPFIMIVFNL